MSGFDTSTPVDTHGWDVVLSLPVPAVNEALAGWMATMPARFIYEESEGPQPFRLEGRFGTWSVAGGSGTTLILTIPLAEGRLTVPAGMRGPLPAGTHDIAGCHVSVAAGLRFERGDAPHGVELLFAFDAAMDIPAATLTASGSAQAPAALSPMVAAVLPEAIASCLAANAAAFRFAFAALAPTSRDLPLEGAGTLAYTVSGRPGGARHLMIFYAAPGGSPLAPEVSGLHGGTEQEVVCALSSRLVLDHVLKPALLRALSATQDDLTVGPGLGPDLDDDAAPPFAIDPANIRGRIEPGGIGRLEAINSFPIRLVQGDSTRIYTLNAFGCELEGNAVRMTYRLQHQRTALFITLTLGVSGELQGRLDLTATRLAGRPAGLRFRAIEMQHQASATSSALTERVFGAELEAMRAQMGAALADALASLTLPLRITALGGADVLAEAAYLNGGLALSGRLAPVASTAERPSDADAATIAGRWRRRA